MEMNFSRGGDAESTSKMLIKSLNCSMWWGRLEFQLRFVVFGPRMADNGNMPFSTYMVEFRFRSSELPVPAPCKPVVLVFWGIYSNWVMSSHKCCLDPPNFLYFGLLSSTSSMSSGLCYISWFGSLTASTSNPMNDFSYFSSSFPWHPPSNKNFSIFIM